MPDAARIDTHQHLIPPRYRDVLEARGERPGGIDPPTWSRGRALRVMDANGIATGILSVSTPGAWLGEAGEARRLARYVNEYAAELAGREPDRFGFFATLTLPDVEGALAELTYALDELHADGVVVLANSAGTYLGDPTFEPLLAELDRRDAVVFVHPGELPGPTVDGIPAFTADFLLDTTRTALSLMLNGALERHPRIRFVLAHAGGFVPYISYRILLTMLQRDDKLHQLGAIVTPEHTIARHEAMLRRFYWDTALSASPSALAALLQVSDPTHITFGSDWPFAPAAAVRFMTKQLDRYPMEAQLRAAIDRGNARELLGR